VVPSLEKWLNPPSRLKCCEKSFKYSEHLALRGEKIKLEVAFLQHIKYLCLVAACQHLLAMKSENKTYQKVKRHLTPIF